MTPEFFELWRTSLRLRPLLWLTPCIVGGSILGLQLTAVWETATLSHRWLFTLILLLLGSASLTLSIQCRTRHWLISRVAFGSVCIGLMCLYAAWRTLPPQHDISRLVVKNINRSQPLRAPQVTLRGYVADHPQRGEFSTQFSLECQAYDIQNQTGLTTQSFVWITVPPDTPIQVGDAIQVKGELHPLARASNPGQREEHWRFVLNRCWSRLLVKEPTHLIPIKTTPRYSFKRLIARWRVALLQHYERAFVRRGTPYPYANAQLLTAMVFGEGGLSYPLPSLVREEFRIAGLSHILVASGSQIGFCGLLLLGLGKVLGLRGYKLLLLVIPLIFLYATLAGGAPSILRAAVAGVLLTIAVLIGRDTDPLSLWLAALLTLVVVDPAQLMSLSLQLSFAAAWGLITITPLLKKPIYSCFGQNFVTDLVSFSLAAQLGILPLLLYHFGKLSLAGLGANLLGVPLASFLVASGIAGLFLPLAWINEWLTHSIAQVATFFAAMPGAQIERSPIQLGWAIVYYAILLVLISVSGVKAHSAMQKSRQQTSSTPSFSLRDDWLVPLAMEFEHWRRRIVWPSWLVVAILVASVGLMLAGYGFYRSRPQPFRLAMLDVGQGEGLVAISPERQVILIDGGGDVTGWRADVGRSVIVPYLQSRGVRKIDLLVLTHTDADHCNGLLSVLKEVPVARVLDGTSQHNPAAIEYNALKREILRQRIPITMAQAGERMNLGSIKLEILSPSSPAMTGDNNNSVVLRLDYESTSLLLTGDMEREAEERLLARGANLRCTILKAAHHGSHTSSTQPFLNAAQPQAALISCGRYNQFGHPATDVLHRLDATGIPVFRTDLDGAVEVFSDGRQCWVNTAR